MQFFANHFLHDILVQTTPEQTTIEDTTTATHTTVIQPTEYGEPETTQLQISNMDLTTSDDSISDNKHVTTTPFPTTVHDGDTAMTSVKSQHYIDTTTIDKFLSSPLITTEMIKGMVLIGLFCTMPPFPLENRYLSGISFQISASCLAWYLAGI